MYSLHERAEEMMEDGKMKQKTKLVWSHTCVTFSLVILKKQNGILNCIIPQYGSSCGEADRGRRWGGVAVLKKWISDLPAKISLTFSPLVTGLLFKRGGRGRILKQFDIMQVRLNFTSITPKISSSRISVWYFFLSNVFRMQGFYL